ncbi:MAG: succinate dehydrogenase assembly factor 2 [Rhodospirillales bacterium]|nr:succinate dehydrogenase assembly factor 2 [Rhodospirillales bacterium]
MSDLIEKKKKRLNYRSWHRGTKELDLLIGSFADRHLAAMDAAQLERYEALLEVPEPQLYDWITGKAAPPAEHDNDVTRRLLDFQLKPPIA